MKTKTAYEPDRKRRKGRISKLAEFTVSVTESMSERFKVSGPGAGGVLLDLRRGLSFTGDQGSDRDRTRHRYLA